MLNCLAGAPACALALFCQDQDFWGDAGGGGKKRQARFPACAAFGLLGLPPGSTVPANTAAKRTSRALMVLTVQLNAPYRDAVGSKRRATRREPSPVRAFIEAHERFIRGLETDRKMRKMRTRLLRRAACRRHERAQGLIFYSRLFIRVSENRNGKAEWQTIGFASGVKVAGCVKIFRHFC